MNDYELLEVLLKGTLILTGVVLGLAVVGFLAVVVAPFAVGLALSDGLYFGRKREEIEKKALDEYLANKRWREWQAEQRKERELQESIDAHNWYLNFVAEQQKKKEEQVVQRRKEEEAERVKLELEKLEKEKKLFNGSFETLGSDVFLESKLSALKRGELFAKNYKRLKVSPFGDSGAAFYWVCPRHNESKEHAFFSYLIKALLEVYAEEVWLCTTRGPDVIVKHDGKKFCFDVETGSNWARRREWVKRKFHYYGKEYDKSFIFVTSKKLKFKYSKLGIVVTRGTLRKTICQAPLLFSALL